jgi:hypothetical protein
MLEGCLSFVCTLFSLLQIHLFPGWGSLGVVGPGMGGATAGVWGGVGLIPSEGSALNWSSGDTAGEVKAEAAAKPPDPLLTASALLPCLASFRETSLAERRFRQTHCISIHMRVRYRAYPLP